MHWYERAAHAIKERGHTMGVVGAALGITSQNAGQKLRGERGVSVDELKVIAGLAGMTVSEMVGDDAVVLELEDEKDVIELYRLLSPEQRKMWLQVGQQFLAARPPEGGEK